MYLSSSGGTITVSLDATYQFQDQSELIINREISIGGKESQKLWGTITKFDVPLRYVVDSDASQINEWWDDNEQLAFNFDGTSYEVRIINGDRPIQSMVRPYQDECEGHVILNVI